MSFRLKKGEPQNLIYTMDYKTLDSDEDEYYELFESSGWNHVSSLYDIHIFSSEPGTVPIYTDRDTNIKKYEGSIKSYMKALIFMVFAFIALYMTNKFIGPTLNSEIFSAIILIAAMIIVVLGV